MEQQKPKYDFYENALFLDDPIQADLNRKAKACAPKIGTEPRVSPYINLTKDTLKKIDCRYLSRVYF